MSSPEALLSVCATDEADQQQLLSRAKSASSLWDNWLLPISSESETGEDPAYNDDFQSMREEINKLSGTSPELLCQLAEKLLLPDRQRYPRGDLVHSGPPAS